MPHADIVHPRRHTCLQTLEAQIGIHVGPTDITQRRMIRVEHYGKGAPAWATQFSTPRAVPAVTGAFMSIDRAWFEKLGGFSEEYMFGSYEDADLCLKSLQAGVPAWVHNIRMWHLEGKGSRRLPQHEGGTMLNRWSFSRKWESIIVPNMVGRAPRHPLLTRGGEPAPIPAAATTPRKPVTEPVLAPQKRASAGRPARARSA